MCESQVEIEIPGPDPGGQPCTRLSHVTALPLRC